MKKIFVAILILISLCSRAQTDVPVFGRWKYQYLKVDSSFRGPQDTLSSASIGSTAVKGSTLYIKLSTGYWTAITGAGGSGVWGFISGTLSSQSDLMVKFGTKYDTTVRKMDTLYAVTDSTFGYYINGQFRTFKARGSIISFNGRNGAVVLTSSDVTLALGYTPSNLPNVVNSLQVINNGNTISWQTGIYSARPAPGNFGSYYTATDSLAIYFDNGISWLSISKSAVSVPSVFGRTGAVTAQIGDYTPAQVGLANVLNSLQIINTLGTPSASSDLFANRPAAGTSGRLFIATDTKEIYRDNGASWDKIGSGASGGVSTYAALTDVNLTSLINGQVAQYNSSTGKWVNITPTNALVGLANVPNVDATNATNISSGILPPARIGSASIDLTTKVTGLLPDANIASAANWNAKMTNFGGAPGQLQGTYAGIPAATSYATGTTYIAQDSGFQYVDTGSGGTRGWKKIGSGGGTSNAMTNFGSAAGWKVGLYSALPAANTLPAGTHYTATDSAIILLDTGSGGTAGWKLIARAPQAFNLVLRMGVKPYHGSTDTLASGTGAFPYTENDSTDYAFFDQYFLHENHEATLSATDSIPIRTSAGKELLASPLSVSANLTKGQRVMTDPTTGFLNTQAEILHQPVRLATAAALPANTYNNGTAGVGATLTANSNGALTVDGVAVAANDRILVKNEATQANNGIYTVTQAGSGGTPYILTRGGYSSITSNMAAGSHVFVQAGTANANTVFYQQTTGTVTFGSTNLVYAQTAGSGGSSQNVQQVVTTGNTYTQANTYNYAGFPQSYLGGMSVFDSSTNSPASWRTDTALLVHYGNSIDNITGASDEPHSYAQLTADKYRGLLKNYAVSGSTIQVDGFARIPFTETYNAAKFRYVLIGGPENDIINSGNNATWDTAHCGPVLRAIVDSLITHGWPASHIILRSALWILPSAYANATLARQAQYWTMVQSVATMFSCNFVDAYTPFLNHGTVFYWDQQLHPNNTGHAFLSMLVYNTVGDSARVNEAAGIANNRLTDIRQLQFHSNDSVGQQAQVMLIDTNGKVGTRPGAVIMASDLLPQAQGASVNLAGYGAFGNYANNAIPASINLYTPGSTQTGSLRITAGPPAGWSGAAGNLTYSSGILHMYNYIYPSGPVGPIAFNEVGAGISMFATATATGGPEVGQFNGGISATFGGFSSNLAGGLVGKHILLGYNTSSDYGFIATYDHTGNVAKHMVIGNNLTDTFAFGAATFSAPAKFQFNGSLYASGLAGIGTNPLTTSSLALPGSTSSLSSLNIASSTSKPATGVNGDFSYDGSGHHLWFWDNAAWHDLLTAGGGTSLPIDDVNVLFQNHADATKQVQFSLANITTSTIRTATFPNTNFTFAGQDIVNSFTGASTHTATETFNVTNGDGLDITGSLTGSSSNPGLVISPTWNTTGNANGLYINPTNTASGASSNLLLMALSNTPVFTFAKGGNLTTTGSSFISTGASVTIANNTTSFNVTHASLFGTNDAFMQPVPGTSGYGAFESSQGLGLVFSTIAASKAIWFAPNRSIFGGMATSKNWLWGTGTDNSTALEQFQSTTTQLALHYDASHYTTFTTGSGGNLDIEHLTGLTINSGALPTAGVTDSLIAESTSSNVATIKKVLRTGQTVASAFVGGSGSGNTSVAAYTVPADGTYEVGTYTVVNSISGGDILGLHVSWTDENSNTQTYTWFPQGTSSGNITGTGSYQFSPVDIRVKSGTTITISSSLVTGGSINYDVDGRITFIHP